MKLTHILYNPLADNKHGYDNAKALSEQTDGEKELIDFTKIKDIPAFLSNTPNEDKIILTGGDGTINFFINEVKNYDKELYYYPAGSGNDFMTDVVGAGEKKIIPIGEYIRNLPTVTVNGVEKCFINGIGYGIDGYCCEVGDKLRGKSDKPVNYAGIAIKGMLFHFKPRNATVIVDGVKHTYKNLWLAPTMNGRYYGGGMNVAPSQDRHNNVTLSVVPFFCKSKLKTLMVFPSIFKGEHVKHTEMVEVLTGKEIEVTFDKPTALQIDGETVLDVLSYRAVAPENAATISEKEKLVQA